MTTGAAPVPTTSPSANSAPSFNRTGFTNLYVLTISGNGGNIITELQSKDRWQGSRLCGGSKQHEFKNIIY